MALTNEELVGRLFQGMLLRAPSEDEAAWCRTQLDLSLMTPTGLVLLGTGLSEFTDITHDIASMYQAAFGRYAAVEELMAWRTMYDTGLDLAQIGRVFVLSAEFREANPGLNETADYVQALARSGLGRDAAQAELDVVVPLLESGESHYGDLLLLITGMNGRGLQAGLAMLYAGITGQAPDDADIEALGSDLPVAINSILAEGGSSGSDYFFAEINGLLTLSGTVSEPVTLNLDTLLFLVNGETYSLDSGEMADVVSVNAETLAGGKVNFTGSSAAETYVATDLGDTIRGGGGADVLYAGDGTDSFVFEATAAENGVDVIHDFLLGSDGDVLDFSAFLNLTGTGGGVSALDAESTAEQAWSNGDVLVVEGNGLTSSGAVAALFGEEKPLAAPTGRGKVVVITADIVGDASVWYVVNQTDLPGITVDEVVLAVQLTGVNNLCLVGFDAVNFA